MHMFLKTKNTSNKCIMRACLFFWILLAQTLASQEFYYIQRLEGESVDIVCVANKAHPSFLYLRRRFAHSESVLNVSEDEGARADSETEGRVKISSQLNSHTVIVTLSQLKRTDTGLYVCAFSGNQSDELMVSTTFLLVQTGEPCSCRSYSRVIYTISAGVCVLVLTAVALFVTHYKKPCVQKEPQTTVPIYEDMSSVQGKDISANHHHVCPPNPQDSASDCTNVSRKTKLENLYGSLEGRIM